MKYVYTNTAKKERLDRGKGEQKVGGEMKSSLVP